VLHYGTLEFLDGKNAITQLPLSKQAFAQTVVPITEVVPQQLEHAVVTLDGLEPIAPNLLPGFSMDSLYLIRTSQQTIGPIIHFLLETRMFSTFN